MRRAFLAFVFIAVAACGKNPTQPDNVRTWSGTITFKQVITGALAATADWTGTVSFDASPTDPTGSTFTFRSGSGNVTATYVETAPCAADGAATAAEVTIDAFRNSKLNVQADGSYTGNLSGTATILVHTQPCSYNLGQASIDSTVVGLNLIISGKANGLNLTGTMVPTVVDTATLTGSWNFSGSGN